MNAGLGAAAAAPTTGRIDAISRQHPELHPDDVPAGVRVLVTVTAPTRW